MFALVLNPEYLAPLWLLPGGGELWLIAIIVLVLFGGPKIPEFFRGLGKGVSELKKGLKEGEESSSEDSSPGKSESDKP